MNIGTTDVIEMTGRSEVLLNTSPLVWRPRLTCIVYVDAHNSSIYIVMLVTLQLSLLFRRLTAASQLEKRTGQS